MIRVEVDNFEGLHDVEELKAPVEIGNLNWTFGAFSETSKRTNNVRHLGFILYCNKTSRSNLWNVTAEIQFKLIKAGSDIGKSSNTIKYTFSWRQKKLEVPDFMNWQEVTCPENGFVSDNTAVIEAHIQIKAAEGIQTKTLPQTFGEPVEHLTDVVLLVEGRKIHVSKQVLAQYSNYFRQLLYSSQISEFAVPDVIYLEFVDLLNLIYPSSFHIDAKNISHILNLAEKFQMPQVLEKCENFLISTSDVQLIDTLKVSETYKFSELQDHCLNKLTTHQEVVALSKQEGFEKLGDVTRNVILELLFEKIE